MEEKQLGHADNSDYFGTNIEKNIDETYSRVDDELRENRLRISVVENTVGEIIDKLKVYEFLKEHPLGHSFEINYTAYGSVVLTVSVAGINRVYDLHQELTIRRADYQHWKVSVVEDIPITKSKRLIHVAIEFENLYVKNDIFHSFFILDKDKNEKEMLKEIDNPVSYLSKTNDVLSQIGLPLPRRYIKKMSNMGLTLKLPKSAKRFVTVKNRNM